MICRKSLGGSAFEPEGFFTVIDVKSGKELHREKLDRPVDQLAFCAKTQLLAPLIEDRGVRIWKVETK